MFITEWICILTAGATVDGRNVEPEVLEQIAETYDPEVYNARINIEHNQFGYKLGSVAEVKAEEMDGAIKLFARLKPTDYFLTLIQAGQKVHTSVEFVLDFAKTGKAYLTGLAVTDTPASLGTTEMHLSVQADGNKQAVQTFSTNEVIEPQPKKTNFFDRLLSKEDESMDAATVQLLTEMNKTQSEVVQQLNKMSDAMTTMTETLSKIGSGSGDSEVSGTDENGKDPEKFTQLKTAVDDLKGELSQVKTALEKFTDEGFRHNATGANTSNQEQEDENLVL
ncbi:GPO family capsid scaffolding protein [Thiomicrorhabdus sp.]|uniref:GPO family capsid scaffolding protein n=1 Tax=Thiomicrorhabdus sp. TaxID=2039724 RepID=UPI003565850C